VTALEPPRARTFTLLIIAGLMAQLTIGMVVNLYVATPTTHPGARAANYFTGVATGVRWAIEHAPWSLAIHAALGVILVLATIARLLVATRHRDRRILAATAAGAAFTLGAAFNGASFLNYGHAISSLLMAILLVLALASYTLALYY
jgi:hypothetical protein